MTGIDRKPDFERCLARVDAWFNGAVIDRPPVRFYKPKPQISARQPPQDSPRKSLEDLWLDTDHQIQIFEESITQTTFRAETFPIFIPNLGPSVYSAFYGGRLEFGETTSWYEPIITDVGDLSPLDDLPFENMYFRKLDELMRAGLARCRGRYWVGYPDLHPSLDCVAAWCGVEPLFLAMVEEPEKLAPLLELSVRDFHPILSHFDSALKAADQPSVTWIRIPCAGKFHVPSCDASSMMSTDHFEQFSLPLLRLELPGITHAVYHVDGRGVARHLDVILDQPEIRAIQWVQGAGSDSPILQWMPLLERVRAAGRPVMVDVPLEDLDEFITRMPPEGLFLCLRTKEEDEENLLRRIERW